METGMLGYADASTASELFVERENVSAAWGCDLECQRVSLMKNIEKTHKSEIWSQLVQFFHKVRTL